LSWKLETSWVTDFLIKTKFSTLSTHLPSGKVTHEEISHHKYKHLKRWVEMSKSIWHNLMIMQNSKSFTFQVMWKYFHSLQGKTINMKKRIEQNGKRWIGNREKTSCIWFNLAADVNFIQKKNP
jgi:hypothetical protein